MHIYIIKLGVGKIPKRDFLRSIFGSLKLFYDEKRYLLEYAKYLGEPTFEEARALLKATLDYLELPKRIEESLVRDKHVRGNIQYIISLRPISIYDPPLNRHQQMRLN